jgi:hypothetical protein
MLPRRASDGDKISLASRPLNPFDLPHALTGIAAVLL